MLIERNGAKRWRLKYRTGGVERPLAIGTFPNTSLANARDARGATRKLIAEGKDPNEATRERVVTELAASAIGMGTIANGQAFISLGKSGVFFFANDSYRPNPEQGVHIFCHALPGKWHQMAVILSAAGC